jgi:hypothetical protein
MFLFILQCIRDLLNKSGKQPAREHAAVWVPDNEATTCMLCKKTKFGVLERRVRFNYSKKSKTDN